MECPLCLGPFSSHCGRCGWKPSEQVPEIDVHEAKHLLDNGAVFVDVRTPEERQIASITPSAFIPLYELAARCKELKVSPSTTIVTYCHHGRRSLVAADFLKQKGFNAMSMSGGIDEWSTEVDPEVPSY